MSTSADVSAKNSSLSSAKLDTVSFPTLDTFHLTYPMHFIDDLAQTLVISIYLPDSTSKPPSLVEIMPLAALITIVVFTTPPAAGKFLIELPSLSYLEEQAFLVLWLVKLRSMAPELLTHDYCWNLCFPPSTSLLIIVVMDLHIHF